MKRGLAILIILFLFPILSAASINLKDTYDMGETIIAKVEGNFYDTIYENNIYFYRLRTSGTGYLQIPMDYDLIKLNSDYYIRASLINKLANNYSIKIKDIRHYQSGILTDEDIVKDFSVTENKADFSVDPGFALTSNDFSVEIQNLQDSTIDLDISSFSELASVSSTSVGSQQTKNIWFTIQSLTQDTLGFITMSTSNLEYELPISLIYTPSPPTDYCGDEQINPGEQCDADDWGVITGCSDFDFNDGTLSCNAPGTQGECTFDTSNCFNTIEVECDGDTPCPDGYFCEDNECIEEIIEEDAYCGDEIKNNNEDCDTDDWGSIIGCESFGFDQGDLSCVNCRFDTSQCSYDTGPETDCTKDSDCFNGVCTSQGICVECEEKSDCKDYEECENNECVRIILDCEEDDDCDEGVCEENTCVDCRGDDDCGDEFCKNNECVECKKDDHCEDDEECNNNECVKKEKQCTQDTDCNYGYDCIKGQCVKKECMRDTDCRYGFECINETCILKRGDECINDDECAEGEKCAKGNCVEQADVNVDPEITLLCNEQGGQTCGDDATCEGDYKIIRGSECCLGTCKEKPKSSTGKIIGWSLVIIIGLFLIWFFKTKTKRVKRSPNLLKIGKR